jgi:hypothetical protein
MIKFEISGTGEEVRTEILRLLGLQEPGKPAASLNLKNEDGLPAPAKKRRTRKSKKPAAAPQYAWTVEDAENLMKEIKTNAKKILAELANKPDGYPRTDLMQAMGCSEQTIRGRLSSVASALKRMDNKPSPISRQKVEGVFTYKLDPVMASVVKQSSI